MAHRPDMHELIGQAKDMRLPPAVHCSIEDFLVVDVVEVLSGLETTADRDRTYG
jgi:hypothetical protein